MQDKAFNGKNFILMTDAYKQSHWKMLPKDLEYQEAYIESRGVTDKGVTKETLFCGIMPYVTELDKVRVTQKDLDEAIATNDAMFGQRVINVEGWKYIIEKLNGRIPVEIKAVKEGTVLPCSNVLVTVRNTDPNVPWIVNHIETSLLRAIWYPTTVASTSFAIKKLLNRWAEKTSSRKNNLFWLNDFGARGVSSGESSEIGGAAHLISFSGTDNIEAIQYIRKYYDDVVYGFSVPASEHSATIVHGGEEHEAEAYKYFMKAYPEGTLSIVSDSYDIRNAVDNIFGHELRHKIFERNGSIVIRPDSGFPPMVVTQVLQSLYKHFGGTTNQGGYIKLNPKVSVIYGDFIKYGMIDDICAAMEENNFAIDNIIFGMGGALLQQIHRDTYRFAMKVSWCKFKDGHELEICKSPKTDPSKNSKAGILQLIKDENGNFKTQKYNSVQEDKNCLEVFYKDKLVKEKYSFSLLRKEAEKYL